jgi:PAT family beta-lactamase induction signal transducer AmpG
VPSLYFAQAIPYVVVMSLSVIMYKDMGISNTDIAFYTSLLYLPWVIKPLWSPVVDMFGTKRGWIVRCSWPSPPRWGGGRCAAPAGLLHGQPGRHVADGLQLGHPRHLGRRLLHARPAPAAAGGLRRACAAPSTAWRRCSGQGPLVVLAGYLATSLGDVHQAWAIVFFVLAGLFFALFGWHQDRAAAAGGRP